MFKKHGLKLLIALIVIQLCVPAGMILSSFTVSSKTEKYGTEYRIPVDYMSFNEGNGFLYYSVNPGTNGAFNYTGKPYTSLSEGEDGFAVLESVYEAPENSSYIKNKKNGNIYSFPASRIYVGKLKYADGLWLVDKRDVEDDEWYENWLDDETVTYYSEVYLLAYVYNGKVSVKDVYIDGVPAKEFFAQIDAREEASQPAQAPQE